MPGSTLGLMRVANGFLYSAGVSFSALWGLLLGSFHVRVEADASYWAAVLFGFVFGLGANLGLLLVPMATGKGWCFRLAVAVAMLPAAMFFVAAGWNAVSRPVSPLASAFYIAGIAAYALGYALLAGGRRRSVVR